MAVELVCDNCGQRKILTFATMDTARDWDWISVNVGDAAYTFGQLSIKMVECGDCKRAANDAAIQARKEALAIRAVKGA